MSRPVERHCDHCGKKFTPQRRRDQRFCSCWCKRAEWSAAHPRVPAPGEPLELFDAIDPNDPHANRIQEFQGASSHV